MPKSANVPPVEEKHHDGWCEGFYSSEARACKVCVKNAKCKDKTDQYLAQGITRPEQLENNPVVTPTAAPTPAPAPSPASEEVKVEEPKKRGRKAKATEKPEVEEAIESAPEVETETTEPTPAPAEGVVEEPPVESEPAKSEQGHLADLLAQLKDSGLEIVSESETEKSRFLNLGNDGDVKVKFNIIKASGKMQITIGEDKQVHNPLTSKEEVAELVSTLFKAIQ